MVPWFWFWAPQVHFPWSGDVAQRIEPDTNWFFGAIAPGAGDAAIERKAFQLASYGKQLGLLTEVVLALADQTQPKDAQAKRSLERLRKLAAEIEALKDAAYQDQATTLAEQVLRLKAKRPREFERLQAILAASPRVQLE